MSNRKFAVHAPTRREPHVDSEEAVQRETRRVARELEPINRRDFAEGSRSTSSRNDASPRGLGASQEHLRHRASDATTQPDISGRRTQGVRSTRSSARVPRWYEPVAKFWRANISLEIEEGAHRDHLALERTFLGYLRTSLILVMTGVIIAQLFRLQHTDNPNPHFGFYVIGRPLSVVFITTGIFIVLVGAFRFWKLQQGLVRGKAYAGGWEIMLVMVVIGLLLVGTFALVLGVNIEKAIEGD